MSMAILIGVLNLIVEGQFKTYYQNLKTNPFFIAVLLFFTFHLVGLLWSENMDYGLNDIRRKLSMLAVPVVLISKPISSVKDYKKIVFCFIGFVCLWLFLCFSLVALFNL